MDDQSATAQKSYRGTMPIPVLMHEGNGQSVPVSQPNTVFEPTASAASATNIVEPQQLSTTSSTPDPVLSSVDASFRPVAQATTSSLATASTATSTTGIFSGSNSLEGSSAEATELEGGRDYTLSSVSQDPTRKRSIPWRMMSLTAVVVLLLVGIGSVTIFRGGNHTQTGDNTQTLSSQNSNLLALDQNQTLSINGNLEVKQNTTLQTLTVGGNVSANSFTQNGHAVCDTSNNCSSLGGSTTGSTTTNITNTSVTSVTNAVGVSSLNSLDGDLTLGGTTNQITVGASGNTLTLSTPQDIGTASTPTFGGLTLNGNLTLGSSGVISGNTLQHTSSGQDLAISAGSDSITFTADGRNFIFPTSGGANQTICTTGISCAAGGGQAVILAPGSAQTNNTTDAAIFINDTGGGNLLQLQSGGSDVFVVDSNGAVTGSAGLTLTAGNFLQSGSGTLTTGSGAVTLNGATTAASTLAVTTLGAADTVNYICRNSSNQLATCINGGSGAAFTQGGNSFGTTAILGTIDSNALNFITANTTKLTLSTAGSLTFASGTGNFDQSASSGTFNTGTGAVVLNGNTSVSANKTFTVNHGATTLNGAVGGSSTALTVNSGAASNVAEIIRGAASQTSDLLQIQDSGSSNLLRVDSLANLESLGYFNNAWGGAGYYGNHVAYSEQFDQWTQVFTSVSADSTTAPNFTQTADTLTGTNSSSFMGSTTDISLGATVTFSVWLKALSGTQNVKIEIQTSGGAVQGSSTVTATTTWQRFSVTVATSGSGTVVPAIRPTTTGSSGSVYGWGAQVINDTTASGSTPGAYVRTGASVVSTTNGVVSNGNLYVSGVSAGSTNAATIDTGAASNTGLLIKGVASQTGDLLQLKDSSSNILLQADKAGSLESTSYYNNFGGGIGRYGNHVYSSENFDTSACPSGLWKSFFCVATVNTDNAAAPNGQTTADTFNTTGPPLCGQTDLSGNNGTLTFSVWLRATSGTKTVGLDVLPENTCMITLGPVGSAQFTVTTTWQRYSVTVSTASMSGILDAVISPTTAGAGSVIAWGAQVEISSTAGVYIPTSSTRTYTEAYGIVSNADLITGSGNVASIGDLNLKADTVTRLTIATAGTTTITGISGGNSSALTVASGAASNVGLVVQAAASQTADNVQVKDSTGANIARIDKSGNQENLGYINNPFGGLGQYSNLLIRSEQFDVSTWVKTNVSNPTGDTIVAPDTNQSAEILADSSSGGSVAQTSNTAATSNDYTFSVWLKATSTHTADLRIDGATSGTGTKKTVTVTTTWQRFSVTQNTTGFTGNVKVLIFPGGTGASGTVHAWGGQLIQSSAAGAYIRTSATAFTTISQGLISDGGVSVVNQSASIVPLFVQGSGAQSASYLRVENNGGNSLLEVKANTDVMIEGNLTTEASSGSGGNPLTVKPGGVTAGAVGAALNLIAGDTSGGTTGGSVYIDSGSGPTTNGAINIGTQNAGVITIGSTAQTTAGTINIGQSIGFNNTTINIGAATLGSNGETQSINIGSSATGSGRNKITLGTTTSKSWVWLRGGDDGDGVSALRLESSGGTIAIGRNAIGQTIQLGNTTGSTSVSIQVGTGNFSLDGVTNSTYTIGASTTTGTITIGGTAQTGTTTLGRSTASNTINIGSSTGNGNTQTITIGNSATSGSNTNVTIGSTEGSSSVSILCGTGACGFGNNATQAHTTTLGSNNTTSTTNLQAGSGGINIGTSSSGSAIQIGNIANAISQTINIGNNTTSSSTDTVLIGNLLGSSTTTLQGGTGSAAVSLQVASTGTIAVGTNAASFINIGTGAFVHVITIGDAATAGQTISIGSNAGLSSTTTILGSAAAGAIKLDAGTSTSTSAVGGGSVNVGSSAAQTVNVGTGAFAHTINIGTNGSSLQTITIGSLATAAITTTTSSSTLIRGGDASSVGSEAIRLQTADAGAIAIGTSTQTGTLTFGLSTDTQTINIGAAATASGKTLTLHIGDGGAAGSTTNITIGSAVAGTLTVQSAATFNKTLTVGGHIIGTNTSGSTTVAANTAVCGTGCTVTISGNDTDGLITVNTGTGVTAGTLGTVTFASAYGAAPRVVLTPETVPGSSNFPQYYYGSNTTTFDLKSYNALTDSVTYKFSYHIIQ